MITLFKIHHIILILLTSECQNGLVMSLPHLVIRREEGREDQRIQGKLNESTKVGKEYLIFKKAYSLELRVSFLFTCLSIAPG